MSATPSRPGSERRRQLRQQRLRERLRNGWRLLVLLALSGGLGYGLLRQGWILNGPNQVEVIGSALVRPEHVVRAAQLTFPQSLLALQPKQIATALVNALPVERVRVSRLMAPARLRVELADRQAVARAQRRSAKGIEQGYVDSLGHWLSMRQGRALATKGSKGFLVEGWQPNHRPVVALVLAERERLALGSDLRQLRFDPSGTIWLQSARLGQVRLGPPDSQLARRLEVLGHLQKQLPDQLQARRLQSIDLSDPEQPELGLPGPAAAPPKPPS